MLTRIHVHGWMLAALLCLGACAHQPPVPEFQPEADRFPSVAAEYRTVVERDGQQKHEHASDVTWRLWRESDRLITENLAAHTGEVWQRDGATLFHQKVFHEDRKSVEYQMDAMNVSEVPLSWAHRSLLVDPKLLGRLTQTRTGWRNGYPYRRYVGEADGSAWDITIRTDVQLPVAVSRKAPGVHERTDLLAAYEMPSAPWAPTPRDDYELIDSADLGDRQSDPFVVKVQDQLGRPHTH